MRYGSDEERAARSVQFTKGETGYFFYDDAWSKGIPVSNDEYETYLDGGRSEFFEAIAGRKATEPRRPYWRTFKNSCEILPWGFWIISIVGGLVAAKWAAKSESTIEVMLYGALSLFLVTVGIMVLFAQLQSSREMNG